MAPSKIYRFLAVIETSTEEFRIEAGGGHYFAIHRIKAGSEVQC
jgi:hypothetical protein